MKKQNKKIKSNKYPIVKVVWRDSNMYRFQDSIAYALENYRVEPITTVGFLIGFQGKNPVITRELLNKNLDQRCSIVIPKENIVSLVKIKMNNIDETDEKTWTRKEKNKAPF